MGSYGANNNDPTYLRSHKKLPTIQDTALDQTTIIKESKNIVNLLFTKDNKLNLAEFAGREANHTKTPIDDGETPPLLTQPPYKYTILVDTHGALDSSPPCSHKDAINAACLVIDSNLLRDRLMDADDIIFGVY